MVKTTYNISSVELLTDVEFFFLRQYVQPCLLKNPKYTFYTIKSSLKLAYYLFVYETNGFFRESYHIHSFIGKL